MTKVAVPSLTATHTYRADNLRHSKTVDGIITTHIWSRGHIVAERNERGQIIDHFDRNPHGQLLRSERHGIYLFNARGDVVQRVDAQWQILHNYRYSAFGVELAPDEGNSNPFRFAGMYWDAHTQTYMTPNRHFNPRTGRWTQPDPFWNIGNMQDGTAAILQSGNLFMFVMHNPVRFVDPLGLAAMPWDTGLPSLPTEMMERTQRAWDAFWNWMQANDDRTMEVLRASATQNAIQLATLIGLDPTSPEGISFIEQNVDNMLAVTNAAMGFSGGLKVKKTLASAAGGVGRAGAEAVAQTQGRTPAIDNVLANARHTNTTSTGVQNFQSSGGMNAARAQFDSLNPTNVRTASNGTIIGDLPGGTTVNIHPGSSVGGAPTLEIYIRSAGERIKIRF